MYNRKNDEGKNVKENYTFTYTTEFFRIFDSNLSTIQLFCNTFTHPEAPFQPPIHLFYIYITSLSNLTFISFVATFFQFHHEET